MIPTNGAKLVPSGQNYSGNLEPIPWSSRPEVYDHAGNAVRHGRARLNSIRMHYYTAGSGPALLLVHGTPKTNYYWYKLVPLLSKHFTIVAPDVRGFGYTDKPGAEMGYDSRTNAKDLADLMTMLGYDTFYVHGEDRKPPPESLTSSRGRLTPPRRRRIRLRPCGHLPLARARALFRRDAPLRIRVGRGIAVQRGERHAAVRAARRVDLAYPFLLPDRYRDHADHGPRRSLLDFLHGGRVLQPHCAQQAGDWGVDGVGEGAGGVEGDFGNV